MSLCRASGLAIFAAVCLLGEIISSAHAQCTPGRRCATEWSHGKSIELGTVPGAIASVAQGNNNFGPAVGYSQFGNGLLSVPTEWSQGKMIDLGVLPGAAESLANGINSAGAVVGFQHGEQLLSRHRYRVAPRQRH